MNNNKDAAKGLMIMIVLGIGGFIGYISHPSTPTPPQTTTEIQASAQAEQNRLNLIHKNEMEYQAAKLLSEKERAMRPATREEIDAESISVGERIGLKFFLGI